MLRAKDWLKQALRDLEHARMCRDKGFYEWACFSAQQSAEKALKAVYQALGGEAWGHDLVGLLKGLSEKISVPKELIEDCADLDKHYILARYPNGFTKGTPWEHYTLRDAERCLKAGERIVEWCKSVVEEKQRGNNQAG